MTVQVNKALIRMPLLLVLFLSGLVSLALGVFGSGHVGGVPSVQAQTACSAATLRGPYGGAASGSVAGAPLAVAGLAAFDGRGRVAGAVSESVGGVVERSVAFTGTYTVQPDCTGWMVLNGQHSGGRTDAHHFDLVVVDGAREIVFVSTDATTAITGFLKRQ